MIIIEAFKGKSITEQSVEIVERKGRGHPDYICDSIMEAISVELSKVYLEKFGDILHHNIDKGLLAAGKTIKRFGGGKVIKPMELTIGDRATFIAGGKKIPVSEIAVETAKKWLKKNLRFVNPERHMKYRIVLAEGSEELTDIFQRPGRIRLANDTSAAVGYYPLSSTERAVLELEQYLNSEKFKEKFPETGEDVKVMGLRRRDRLELTVAMPLIAEYTDSEQGYFLKKEEILFEMKRFVKKFSKDFSSIEIHYNTLDERERGIGGVYLSLLGTSAEDADSGQVGRGNRVNGLISMNRPMGTEAAAGKNPVSHVGKIYNILSHRIAKRLYEEIEGVEEVYILLLSRIGTPIDRPQMANAQILLEKGTNLEDVKAKAEEIIKKELEGIGRFCLDLARGKYPVC
ncbi:MAG: methionine adenosyltransferase [Thermodesulfovibrionales bacterium]